MPTITGITALPRKSDRFAVLIDGESIGVLSVALVADLGLHVGEEVSGEQRERIADESGALATYDRAVRMLASRGRSVADLRRRLIRAKEPPAHVERALTRLQENGVLNDDQFASQLARTKVQGQGISKRRFRQEMFVRGVPREAADDALERLEEEGGINEQAAVERLAEKKALTLAKLDPMTRQRRLYGFLARRGYDSDVIRDAIRKIERNL